ncbi:LysE family translocator [Vibrio salinus]|uniref:LysE family translocator n=1 Tax=Vibrio salinus TaxID=2899784 RepID=UPI001E4353CA|nr:LysE family translocator [Vibrio salinus]MCE0492687.1 LysE family translocator [Vibrio salinus]
MSIELWLTFVLTATTILVIPGPTIIYVVGQSLNHGKKASLPLSMGVISGDAICITLSLLGLSTVLSIFSAAFIVVKYLGAAYLIYLGLKMVMTGSHSAFKHTKGSDFRPRVLFKDVFIVNALNPKGIIFYSAFMPQFITSGQDVLWQLVILATTFLILALINVLFYSLLASKMSHTFHSATFSKAFNLTGGISLIFAGVYSATLHRK